MRRARRILAGMFVLLFSLGVVAGTVGLWADRTALRTSRFVDAVRPLPRDPAVNRALATFLTDELLSQLDLTRRAEEALPEDLVFLVGPLEIIVRDYTRDAVADVLRSDQFQRIWVGAVRAAHETALAVLDDEETALVVRDGEVTLDLLPAIHEILQRLIERGPGFLGDVELPELDDDATRREIREAVADRFGVELPPDFGQITVFDEDKLSEVQDTAYLVERGLRILVLATLLVGAAALLVSVDRRRTVLQLGLGTAIATYLVFTVLRRIIDDLVDLVPEGPNRDAAHEAARIIARGLRDRAWYVLVAGLLVAAGAYLAGPGRGAVRIRRSARDAFTQVREHGLGRALPALPRSDAMWDSVRAGAIAVGVVVLLVFDLSWLGLFVVLGLVAAALAVVAVRKGSAR